MAGNAFKVGQAAVRIAVNIGKRTKSKEQVLKAKLVEKRMTQQESAYRSYASAMNKLEVDPGNASASRVAGEYLCFVKNDWAEGLPMLAAGNDRALSGLAKRELSGELSAKDALGLGDGWWEVAEGLDELSALHTRRHAARHYQQGLSAVKSVLNRRLVEKRIEEAGALELAIEQEPETTEQAGKLKRIHGPKWVLMADSENTLRKHRPHHWAGEVMEFKDGGILLDGAVGFRLKARNFVYSANVKTIGLENAALRFNAGPGKLYWYTYRGGNRFRMQGRGIGLVDFESEKNFEEAFELKLVVVGNHIHLYAGGELLKKFETDLGDDPMSLQISTHGGGRTLYKNLRYLPLDDHEELAKYVLEENWDWVAESE